MDPIAIAIIGSVVVVIAVWYTVFREEDEKPVSKPNYNPTLTPEKQAEVRETLDKAVKELQDKLPTKAQLEKLTKAGLEDLGREHGVELDKRKTKAKMIADLEAGVKK